VFRWRGLRMNKGEHIHALRLHVTSTIEGRLTVDFHGSIVERLSRRGEPLCNCDLCGEGQEVRCRS